MEYKLQLVEERVKQQQVTALHLICAMAFLGAGAIIFIYNYTITYWGLALLILALTLLVATIGRNKWVTKPSNNTLLRIGELVVSVTLAAYSIYQQWRFPIGMFSVLSVVLAFALFWERKANVAQYVIIDEEGVKLPTGVRKRLIEWTGVEEVLMRYGTLSVDCTDNHLYQWNIQTSSYTKEEVEAFCKSQVEGNRSKRRNDDW